MKVVSGLHLAALVVLASLVVGPARAQDDGEKRSFTRMLNVDALVDNYARFLARKYNLDEGQDEFTQKMLRERTDQFLGKHREELFGLVDRLFEVRAGGSMDANEMLEWGKRIAPIYEEAKSVIIDGNNQWREILNEEQKKIHDEDVKLMNESFANTDDQLTRIVNGEMTIEEFRQGNRRNRGDSKQPSGKSGGATPARRQPPKQVESPANGPDSHNGPDAPTPGKRVERPSPPPGESPEGAPPVNEGENSGAGQPAPQPEGGPHRERNAGTEHGGQPGPGGAAPKGERGHDAASGQKGGKPPTFKDPESEWEKYVREFITKYQLDKDQTDKANAILKESQDQAGKFIDSKKNEVESLDKEITKLNANKDKDKEKDKLKALGDLKKKRDSMAEPIGKIFEKMKSRLMMIPTRAQVRTAEANKGKPAGKDSKSSLTKKGDAGAKGPKGEPRKGDEAGKTDAGSKGASKQNRPTDPPQTPPQQEPPAEQPPEQQPEEGQPEEAPETGG